MKPYILYICIMLYSFSSTAQEDKAAVERTCLDYIEGFYEGDTIKLIKSLKPGLHKFGYWKDKSTGEYNPDGSMTWRQALDYATKVQQKKAFAKPDAPKKVVVLDIGSTIAAAKVTAMWGIDYLLLSRQNGKWMIEQVLWEGPLPF
ncbi:MAG: hypothetical protein EOO13_14140 [Chitinophagaceae bacterium]|nr:MAG: hypothetical protein EOO13_14140 [Chitinophagaceae bacterium]